jgi:hypothetical protein
MKVTQCWEWGGMIFSVTEGYVTWPQVQLSQQLKEAVWDDLYLQCYFKVFSVEGRPVQPRLAGRGCNLCLEALWVLWSTPEPILTPAEAQAAASHSSRALCPFHPTWQGILRSGHLQRVAGLGRLGYKCNGSVCAAFRKVTTKSSQWEKWQVRLCLFCRDVSIWLCTPKMWKTGLNSGSCPVNCCLS